MAGFGFGFGAARPRQRKHGDAPPIIEPAPANALLSRSGGYILSRQGGAILSRTPA